jgi:hypothetical protein
MDPKIPACKSWLGKGFCGRSFNPPRPWGISPRRGSAQSVHTGSDFTLGTNKSAGMIVTPALADRNSLYIED